MSLKEKTYTFGKQIYSFLKVLTRRLRLVKINRNFLVFLVFLAISVGFWCAISLKEQSTATSEFKIKIVGLPKDIIVTSDIPKILKVNYSGSGSDHINYIFKNTDNTIVVNYEDLEVTSNEFTISNTMLIRGVSKELGRSLKINSITPNKIIINYTKGKPKIVPIKFVGNVKASPQYALCNIELLNEDAEVYAPHNMYDSIHCVYTEPLVLDELEDTTNIRIALKKIKGAKVTPDSVDVRINVELFAEKKLSVPIYTKNIPHNKVLRTFPPRAEVTFRVSSTMYNQVDEKDFLILVDFKNIKPNDKNCPIVLEGYPEGVNHIRIEPESVEFVIEQVDN